MARLLAYLALVAVFVGVAVNSCAVPPYGCAKAFCDGLRSVPPVFQYQGFNKDKASTWDTRIGYWFGIYNKRYTSAQKSKLLRKKGGPSINYESFSSVGDVVKYSTARSLGACCNECRKTAGCWMYQYFDWDSAFRRPNPAGFKKGTYCYLLQGGPEKADDPTGRGTPPSGTHTSQVERGDAFSPTYMPSWVGGMCNGNASVNDDPHFVGAQGTRFDFNGELDKSFCLSTDARLHINVRLSGYKDESPAAAEHNGIRSWIKEVAVLWKEEGSGKQHSLHLEARTGKRVERGEDGFLASVSVDGADVPVPSVEGNPDTVSAHGMTFKFLGTFKKGPYDLDRFSLKIDGLVDMTLSMRVAHAKLQRPDDAEAHFNIGINDITTTDAIHGVLGQTYRDTAEQAAKALKYSQISELLHGPIVADGKSGNGFLEGSTKDYETTGIMSANCKFAAF